MKLRHLARVGPAFAFGLMVTYGAAARALPRAGDPKPPARVVDADRRAFDLASVVGASDPFAACDAGRWAFTIGSRRRGSPRR